MKIRHPTKGNVCTRRDKLCTRNSIRIPFCSVPSFPYRKSMISCCCFYRHVGSWTFILTFRGISLRIIIEHGNAIFMSRGAPHYAGFFLFAQRCSNCGPENAAGFIGFNLNVSPMLKRSLRFVSHVCRFKLNAAENIIHMMNKLR